MKNLNERLRQLQQRLGVRQDAVAAIVLALIAFGAVSFTVTTHVGTPAGAALGYMAAVDRADTNYVWTHSIVESPNASAAETRLLDRSALAAQVTATQHSRSAYTVQSVGYVSTGTKVTLAYDTAAGRRTSSLLMRGGAPHSWPVVVDPAGLDLSLPTGAGPVTLDGQTVAAATGSLKVAVFPGLHKLTLGASDLYLPSEQLTDVEATLPSFTHATFANVKLTENAMAASRQVVAKAFQNCAGAVDLKPSTCPQSYMSDITNSPVRWTALGDPMSNATVGVDPSGQLAVTGHYLMKLSYQPVSGRARTIAVGGAYSAALSWDGHALSVLGFTAATTPALARPAATESQVLSALQTQFAQCLQLQAGSAAECPQTVTALYASNFVWHENSDPTQGASVTWDGAQGFFKASGNFDFNVDYDSTAPYSPTRHYQDHSSGQYVADLFWDGSKAVFIGFEK